jgi:non-ribosomal peptide synthase protein (TIGR01720 family)
VTPRASAFGLLRYQGTPLAAQRLAALPRPSVMLNYLGQFGQIEAGTEFRLASESAGPLFDPAGVRPHLWQFVAGVFGGRLRVRCLFSRNLHKQETVASVMRHLRATLETAAADPTRASLPGAVIDNRVSADDLARLASLHAK